MEGFNKCQISTTIKSFKKDDIQEDIALCGTEAGLVESISGLTHKLKSPPRIKMVSEKRSKVVLIVSKKSILRVFGGVQWVRKVFRPL